MDFFPSFNEFNKKIKSQQNQIVYTKFSADLDTPVSLMLKLAKNEKNSFLLESVTGGEIKGRLNRWHDVRIDIHVFFTLVMADLLYLLREGFQFKHIYKFWHHFWHDEPWHSIIEGAIKFVNNRCKSLQIFANPCKSLEILANP